VFTVPPLPGQSGIVIDAPAASFVDQAPVASVRASDREPVCACVELTVKLVMALPPPDVFAVHPSVDPDSKPQFMHEGPVVQVTGATFW